MFAHFGIAAQPAFVIIDPAGETTTLPGALDEDAIEATLAKMTAETRT